HDLGAAMAAAPQQNQSEHAQPSSDRDAEGSLRIVDAVLHISGNILANFQSIVFCRNTLASVKMASNQGWRPGHGADLESRGQGRARFGWMVSRAASVTRGCLATCRRPRRSTKRSSSAPWRPATPALPTGGASRAA